MSPDSTTTIVTFLQKWLPIIGGGGIVGLLVLLFTKFLPWCHTKLKNRSLEKRVGADLYSKGVIEQATKYYIEPFVQSVDPSGGEESRYVYGAKEKIFSAIDNLLYHPTEYRYLILLADSGMGKTSFLLNYYARNFRRWRRKLKIELLPLGIPDLDKRVGDITDKKDKILFLDALDEDTLAIVDHVERLKTLMQLTREFQKILITCRTQFFPKDEEIPLETGVVKIGPKAAGEKGQHVFHKLYLAPFTDKHVAAYLKRQFSVWHLITRHKAAAMVKKIEHLSARPMLLAHIRDLVKSKRPFKYSFELYEEMVEAWLIREEGIKQEIKKEPLRKFSECLAINLFVNRQQRGAERVPVEDLKKIAADANFPIDDTWQLTGRSLLNRDAVGNYKFAHRSIMEYLFVKRFLEMNNEERTQVEWTDQMYRFLLEKIRFEMGKNQKFPNLNQINLNNLIQLKPEPFLHLRNRSQKLNRDEVTQFLKKYNFFDSGYNSRGEGIPHIYFEGKKREIIIDLTTSLMWQQSGSPNSMIYEKAEAYITDLNRQKFAGFSDWRLPTLEEAMSLMEPKKNKAGLYIDERFDAKQWWIWTADKYEGGSSRWFVSFANGLCHYWHLIDYDFFVRGVRFRQSSDGDLNI